MQDMSGAVRDVVFRPRARLVSILGEHLISDQAVGLIELVKNSYDADATSVSVQLLNLADPAATVVVVSDNGVGMTLEDIETKWLSPAVDHKEQRKARSERTTLGRLPIGEKGVGRFAVHQLGRKLRLVTRAAGYREVVVTVDWDEFDRDGYLDAVPVHVLEREPEHFINGSTGTELVISEARCLWTEKRVKKVHRTLRRLQNPLGDGSRSFAITLRCPEFQALEAIDPTAILAKSHYEFRAAVLSDGHCDLEYICRHPSPDVSSREIVEQDVNLVPLAREELQGDAPQCGEFWLNLYVWDRSGSHLTASDVSREELDAWCGVSVFRDGLRVLPYGEPGDDWLLLDQERIQHPSESVGNNQVVGLVQFDQAQNLLLKEKTNREGLIENAAFQDLRALVRAAFRQFTKYWKNDRPPGKESTSEPRSAGLPGAKAVAKALRPGAREDVMVKVPAGAIPKTGAPGDGQPPDVTGASNAEISQRMAVDLLEQHLESAEKSARARETHLETVIQLAATGLAAERVVHEFGRRVADATVALSELSDIADDDDVQSAVAKVEAALGTLRAEFRILAPYEMQGRAERRRRFNVRTLAKLALGLHEETLRSLRIEAEILGDDWTLKDRPTPFLQIIDNLVHNAVWWVGNHAPSDSRHVAIRVDSIGKRILVMDSGPGVDPEVARQLFRPFVSTKAGGKGLGLYISSRLASQMGGRLRLRDPDETLDVPAWATGAVFLVELDVQQSEEPVSAEVWDE